MMQIRSNDFIMNMSFRFTMARELFAGLYYRTQNEKLSVDVYKRQNIRYEDRRFAESLP